MITYIGNDDPVIQVISGHDNFVTAQLETISHAKETFDCCMDSKALSMLLNEESICKEIIKLKNRGVRSRFVTEFDKEDTHYYKMLIRYATEVFHIDGVVGNFTMVDESKYTYYILTDCGKGNITISRILHTKFKPFVAAQEYLFENLCLKATPAKEKVREVLTESRGDFLDTIQDLTEAKKISINLIETAVFEILLLFPSINAFYRAEHSNVVNFLLQASQRGVAVKLLIQADEYNQLRETIKDNIRQKYSSINIQYTDKPLPNKITTMVVDQAVSIAIDVEDDSKNTFEAAGGMAVYSNNESAVSACLSIFQSLWIKSEFDKQNKVKHAYFEMFKGFKLKDEFYTRRWSFREAKETQ